MVLHKHDKTYLLRTATAADTDAITRLIRIILPAFDPSYTGKEVETDLLTMDTTYFEKGGGFFVITHEDLVIASLGLLPITPDCAKLKKMYVAPEHQGHGLAAILVKEAIIAAQKAGFHTIRLETMSIMRKAVDLYHGFGFKEIKAVAVSKRCDIVMEKVI